MQVRGDIAFRDVRFRHAGRSAWTLDGVSFSIDAGSTVALVGPSGSGALLPAAAGAPTTPLLAKAAPCPTQATRMQNPRTVSVFALDQIVAEPAPTQVILESA